MAHLFRNKQYSAFILGQGLSSIGTGMRSIILYLWIYQTSHQSGPAIALLALCEMIAFFLLTPFSGPLVDRTNKRSLLVFCDAVMFILSLALMISLMRSWMPGIYLVVFLMAGVSAISNVAQNAIVAELVENSEFNQANSISVVSEQSAIILGPLIGTLLFKFSNAHIGIAVDAISYLISGVIMFFGFRDAGGNHSADTNTSIKNFVKETISGFSYMYMNLRLRLIMLTIFFTSLSAGINNTVMIFYINKDLNQDATSLGWLSVSNGVLQIIAGLLIAARFSHMSSTLVLKLGLLSMGVGALVIASAPSFWILIFGVALMSFGNSPFNIGQNSTVQEYTAPEYLGRVYSAFFIIGDLSAMAAASAAGFLVGGVGARALLGFSSVLVIIPFLLVLVSEKWKISGEKYENN